MEETNKQTWLGQWPGSVVQIYVENRTLERVILQFFAHFQLWGDEAGPTQSGGPFLNLDTLYFFPSYQFIG